MPTPTPHRNQSPDLQRKSIERLQHKKKIDMKKANNNEVSKPACLYLSKSAQQLQYKAQKSLQVTVVGSNKQLMATTCKYSNNNNKEP